MFYATNAFKNILEKCNTDTDIAQSTRQALKDFVNQPLRSPEHFCSAKNMMKLRNLLSKYNPKILGSFQGDVLNFIKTCLDKFECEIL